MHIAYFDEAGDDGFPGSSESFVLSSVYMRYQDWRANLDALSWFRRQLKLDTGLHTATELHMRALILGKKPYHRFRFDYGIRRRVFFSYYKAISALALRSVNVVINKKKILDGDYRVLDRALTYNAQRIANDITKGSEEHKFLIVADEGRIGSMRKTARRIQKYDMIPSRFGPGRYRKDLSCLIEDPLPKNSTYSHFIQVADAISFVVALYAKARICGVSWPKRMRCIELDDVLQALHTLKPVLNLQACSDPYGIVNYPK